MSLPALKQTDSQLRLFDEPIGNHGSVRTVLGDFAETLTELLFSASRFKTDSRCEYCPDLIFPTGSFAEVKTMGKSRQILIYSGRMRKDLIFSLSHELIYVIWHHTTSTKRAETVDELKSLFLSSMKSIYLIHFSSIYSLGREVPITALNSAYGSSRTNPTYGSGYRIPLWMIESVPHVRIDWQQSDWLF